MIKEAIILAGGLGTRLQSAVPDLPKAMAPVNGRPFLFYVINQLRSEGIERFIFSLGFRHEIIEEYLKDEFNTLQYECSVEKEPLGTGGGILAACYKTNEKNVLIANGDTLYKANIAKAARTHLSKKAHCTCLLKPMQDFDRYGMVEINDEGEIISYREKDHYEEGLINGGLYILNVPAFMEEELPVKFSFEKDYLEKAVNTHPLYGVIDDSYFIDIGIPEDFLQAQTDLALPPLDLLKVNKQWSLFLDRDGVINHELKNEYVRNWGEFKFYPGSLEAIARLSKKFGKVFIVTNQRGISKELMTESDLQDIHQKMMTEIADKGGRVDAIYYCTSLDDKHPERKGNPGLAFRARADFDTVDLNRSIIAGNKMSDMKFGRNAGMYTVFIASTNPEMPFPHHNIDLRYNSLQEFAKAL